jgi:hypothetical protein
MSRVVQGEVGIFRFLLLGNEALAANIVLLGGDFEDAIDGATAAYLLHTSARAEAEAWAARVRSLDTGCIVPES